MYHITLLQLLICQQRITQYESTVSNCCTTCIASLKLGRSRSGRGFLRTKRDKALLLNDVVLFKYYTFRYCKCLERMHKGQEWPAQLFFLLAMAFLTKWTDHARSVWSSNNISQIIKELCRIKSTSSAMTEN